MNKLSRRKFVVGTAAAAFAIPNAIASPSQTKRVLRIAHLSDIHLDSRPVAVNNFRLVMEELNTMKDKPDLIINTGDSVFRADGRNYENVKAQWELLTQMLRQYNRIPVKSCIGNHDVSFAGDVDGDSVFKANNRFHKSWVMEILSLPHRYYTTEIKGWYFIALDSINEKEYSLDAEQFAWLENELNRIPSGSPVCIFSHVSIISVIPLMRSLKEDKIEEIHYPGSRQHRDALRLKNLFHKHPNVKLCLSGHTHQIDEVTFIGVKYIVGGAVSGNWWADDNRPSMVFEEFPPAYTLIDLYEDQTITHKNVFYKFST